MKQQLNLETAVGRPRSGSSPTTIVSSGTRSVGTALRRVYPDGPTLPHDMQALLDKMR